jgi:uncharacterized protein
MTITDERYVLLTTYKRDGSPVSTTVWCVDLGNGSFGFWTSSTSGKVKRLSHTSRVTVQPCNSRGRVKPQSETAEGTARVVAGGELETIRQKVVAKYGFWTKITKVLAKIGGLLRGKPFPYGDRGVIVSL